MSKFTMCFRKIAVFLVVVILVPFCSPMASAHAQEEDETEYTVEVGENAIMKYKETESVRTTEYYVDGVITQRTVYDTETGEIVSYDLSASCDAKGERSANQSKQETVVRYNISDFEKAKDSAVISSKNFADNTVYMNKSASAGTRSAYTLVRGKTLILDGEEYVRTLYGRIGSREYLEDYWYFEAGIAVSVVGAALGVLYPALAPYISKIANAAGLLIEVLAVTDWVLEYYWQYKFEQTAPTYLSFECPYNFVYLKYRRLETTAENPAGWEKFYMKNSGELAVERDEILEYPGLYY